MNQFYNLNTLFQTQQELYQMRGDCYKKLGKYIQATYDYQKSIDIDSQEVSII